EKKGSAETARYVSPHSTSLCVRRGEADALYRAVMMHNDPANPHFWLTLRGIIRPWPGAFAAEWLIMEVDGTNFLKLSGLTAARLSSRGKNWTLGIRGALWIALALVVPATSRAASTLTFGRDVAPIIYTYCSPCHRPGEAAPFSLLTYEDVR